MFQYPAGISPGWDHPTLPTISPPQCRVSDPISSILGSGVTSQLKSIDNRLDDVGRGLFMCSNLLKKWEKHQIDKDKGDIFVHCASEAIHFMQEKMSEHGLLTTDKPSNIEEKIEDKEDKIEEKDQEEEEVTNSDISIIGKRRTSQVHPPSHPIAGETIEKSSSSVSSPTTLPTPTIDIYSVLASNVSSVSNACLETAKSAASIAATCETLQREIKQRVTEVLEAKRKEDERHDQSYSVKYSLPPDSHVVGSTTEPEVPDPSLHVALVTSSASPIPTCIPFDGIHADLSGKKEVQYESKAYINRRMLRDELEKKLHLRLKLNFP
ncbi:hypothetical protein ADUPG1_007081, partial [Aduncisulcus paluster]